MALALTHAGLGGVGLGPVGLLHSGLGWLVARMRILLVGIGLGRLLGGWVHVGVLLGEVHALLGGDGYVAFEVSGEVEILTSRNLQK